LSPIFLFTYKLRIKRLHLYAIPNTKEIWHDWKIQRDRNVEFWLDAKCFIYQLLNFFFLKAIQVFSTSNSCNNDWKVLFINVLNSVCAVVLSWGCENVFYCVFMSFEPSCCSITKNKLLFRILSKSFWKQSAQLLCRIWICICFRLNSQLSLIILFRFIVKNQSKVFLNKHLNQVRLLDNDFKKQLWDTV